MSIFNVADAAAQLARDIDWYIDKAGGIVGGSEPIHDPSHSIAAQKASLGISGAVEYGYIVDYVPYTGLYRVYVEHGDTVTFCYRLAELGGSTIGVQDASSLAVGTHVRYVRHPEAVDGLIIGVEPPYSTDARLACSDQIHQASNCGLQVGADPAHREPFKFGGKGSNAGIHDQSSRNPIDLLGVNEFVRIAETGLKLTLDSYMGQLSADEMTGLAIFYWDQLCRLSGCNLQIWSAPGYELESYDDEGEHTFYNGIAVYPWEAMAQLEGPTKISRERTAKEVQITKPWYARIELDGAKTGLADVDDLQPFHRWRNYGGYLGQGWRRMLITPYSNAPGAPSTGNANLNYSDTTKFTGLFEEQVTLAGHYAARSALGYTIGKRPVIPVPNRVKVVQHASGDKAANYRASSHYGHTAPLGGPVHKCSSDLGVAGSHPSFQRALGVLDLHAHIFNWEGPHPFHYHQKDYDYPQESAMPLVQKNQDPLSFSTLVSGHHLPPPTAVEVQIDHRQGGTAMIFPNSSSLTFLDDGGITLTDGFGSQIRMTGGHIFTSCPGDFFVEAGRNAITWGGRDVILRAYQSVDVTATKRDVRLKAENNMQLLAANGGGQHGLLLESRSTDKVTSPGSSPADYKFDKCGHKAEYTGIILKAKDGAVVNWSKMFLAKTLGEDHNEGIILDANDGEGHITTRSGYFDRWIKLAGRDFFTGHGTSSSGNIKNGVADRGIIWDGINNFVNGITFFSNDVWCYGSVYSKRGYTSPVAFTPDITTAPAALDQSANTAFDTKYAQIGNANTAKSVFNGDVYAIAQPGNDDTIERGEFGLRADEDYKTSSFVLYETHWAQHGRLSDGSGIPAKWQENAVSCRDMNTYPYPGKAKLGAESPTEKAYYQQGLTFVDLNDGLSNDRPGNHETAPAYANPTATELDGNYAIIGE